jgi:hypothetical protein
MFVARYAGTWTVKNFNREKEFPLNQDSGIYVVYARRWN